MGWVSGTVTPVQGVAGFIGLSNPYAEVIPHSLTSIRHQEQYVHKYGESQTERGINSVLGLLLGVVPASRYRSTDMRDPGAIDIGRWTESNSK